MVTTESITDFLSGRRIAVPGASDEGSHFGNTVHRDARPRLRGRGGPPHADSVAGDPCDTDLASVPGELHGAIVMVGADRAAGIVRACIDRCVPRVRLLQGAGPGAVADAAVR